ncbi:MAG: pitrilysin family protein [Phycisphaerae bacterium]
MKRQSFTTSTLMLVLALAARANDGSFDFRELRLDNGLRVLTLEDFSCPIVAVHLWYHVGSKDENPERQGFAHMFEHMMFRGTDRLGPTDHFDLIRRTGGDCNAYTAFDQTVYVQTLPAHQLELALWLEAERMTFLKIDQGNFDTERKVVEEERRLGLNRPYGTMFEKLFAELFKQHPYRWTPIGSIPHLRSASVQELRDFWTRYYVPNNATLVIVGAVKHDDAQALARKCFGWIPRYPDPPRITVKEPPLEARSVTFKEDSAPAPLVGLIYRGVPAGHDDEAAIQLMMTILGGGDSSRCYRELVAEKQLAVAAIGAPFSLEQDGIIALGAAMTPNPFGASLDKVQAALLEQVEKIRNQPVTESELTKARNQMLRSLVTENLSVESKASALGQAAVLEGDPARVNHRIAKIRAVTVTDIQRVAKMYLDPAKVLKGRVESNLLGALFGKKKTEDDAPITAQPETQAPPPGRAGLSRPAGFPTTAPVAGLADFDPTPKFETRTLDNGMKVMVVENHEVPFVTVQLGLTAGAWTESKPATASLAAAMLTKGTARHSEGQLAEELESAAISLSGSASMDNSSVSASCVTDQLDKAMSLMSEVVRTPTFPEDEFEKLRKQVRTGLAVSNAEPGYIADREFRHRVFGDHPYARTVEGEVADVDALKVSDAAAWWMRQARPDSATLIFAGDVSAAKAFSLAQSTFGDWRGDGDKPVNLMPPPPQRAERHIYLIDHPGVQSQIRVGQIGVTREHPLFFTARMVGEYFGGSFSSRLNDTIRVKRGLTYGASGGFSAQRVAGTFTARTFSKNETTVDAVAAIFEELDRLRAEPPGAEELAKTKSNQLGRFAGDRETPQDIARDLWLIESNGLPADYFQRMLKAYSETTEAGCADAARQLVDPSKMTVVVVGPAAKLEEGLKKIAPVTVVKPEPAKTLTPPTTMEAEEEE